MRRLQLASFDQHFHSPELRAEKPNIVINTVVIIVCTFVRLLFPEREELVDVLLDESGVDPSLRAHELTLEDFNKLCGSFVNIADTHRIELLPLRVRKPDHVVRTDT